METRTNEQKWQRHSVSNLASDKILVCYVCLGMRRLALPQAPRSPLPFRFSESPDVAQKRAPTSANVGWWRAGWSGVNGRPPPSAESYEMTVRKGLVIRNCLRTSRPCCMSSDTNTSHPSSSAAATIMLS